MKQNQQSDSLEDAFKALWEFCETEMEWQFFRADWEIVDNPRQTFQNAKRLRDYLTKMQHHSVVAECLGPNAKAMAPLPDTPPYTDHD